MPFFSRFLQVGLEKMERPEATAGQEDEESHDASVRLSHVILIICRPIENFRSTDYVLTQDKSFKKYAKAYADDQDLFFME